MLGARPVAKSTRSTSSRSSVEQSREARARLLDAGDLDIEAQLDALLAHLLGKRLAYVTIEAAQEERPAVELDDAAAHAVEDAGELAGDIAAAHDGDARGKPRQKEGLVRGDGVLLAGNFRHHGPAACRDQDALGLGRAARDLHAMGIAQDRAGRDDLDARLLEELAIDAIEPCDLGVLVGNEARPVEVPLADRPAEARRVLEMRAVMAGIDKELLGDAADVDAGAAQVALLGKRDARAVARRHARRAHPARAAADHEEVVVVCCHRSLAFRPDARGRR